ncbi:MAG: recombinase family protein [Gemmataceae bacterium]
MDAIVGYARVSTDRQGKSGLGLEAQQAAVEAYARANGARLLKLYVEVESGRNNQRPELANALSHARRAKATLVVAKLDRLARSVSFLSALMDADVPFVAVDNPTANRLTLHILAAVAEAEARAISERTKAALSAYKARGGKLGGHLPQCRTLDDQARAKGRLRSAEVRRQLSRKTEQEVLPVVVGMRAEGLTLKEIAIRLNDQGWKTRQSKEWRPVHVCRLLKRQPAATERSA